MEVVTNEYRENRLAAMAELEKLGFRPYGRAYPHDDLSKIRAEFSEGREVLAAGRLMMIRRMGKMNFCTINDGTDKFQLIFRRDQLDERLFAGFKLLHLGDIIGVKGDLFTTQRGEKSIVV